MDLVHNCFLMGEEVGELFKAVRRVEGLFVEGDVPDDRRTEVAHEIVDVLNYLHTQSPPVIVRDLKPDNIMLSSTDRHLRLIDFGIAKLLDPSKGTQPIVKGMGTEAYAPLEQYGGAPTDARSDLYSLGGTLYFLLSGKEPIPAWKRGSKKTGLPDLRQFNDSVSDRTWLGICKLMELHPNHRPQNVAQARQILL